MSQLREDTLEVLQKDCGQKSLPRAKTNYCESTAIWSGIYSVVFMTTQAGKRVDLRHSRMPIMRIWGKLD